MAQSLLLYDGECRLCNAIVRWLARHDPRHLFIYAPIQGDTAATVWPRHDVTGNKLEGLWLVTDWQQPTEHLYHRAEAVLEIARRLGGITACAVALAHLIPRTYRESLYLWIAQNRYHWFGKVTAHDRLPTDERFLS